MFFKLKIKQTDSDASQDIKATDIGYLLYKNPFGKTLKFETKMGDSYIVFNKSEPEECSMSMIVDIDSLDLFKKAGRGDIQQDSLDHYVHNKAYTGSVLFSQALSKCFSTCMSGVCKDKPELVNHKWQIEVELATIQTNRMGEEFLCKLFSELGYVVVAKKLQYDEEYSEWGLSNNYVLNLKHDSITIQDLLSQLYVLVPTINPERHFYVDESTLNGLLKKGGSWLTNHSLKDVIVKRYLLQNKELSTSALEQLKSVSEIEESKSKYPTESELEKQESLGSKRYTKIIDLIKERDEYRTFVDFGCSDGKLIRRALEVESVNAERPEYFKSIIGVDVAHKTLGYQKHKFEKEYRKEPDKLNRINLVASSLMYQDARLLNQEVFVLSEVIEHIDLDKHDTVLNNIFNYYCPELVIMTTPNKDYNKVYEIEDSKMRHRDHRFEWTTKEFIDWCHKVQDTYSSYQIYTTGYIGEVHPEYGGSCQYVVFDKRNYSSRKISDKLLTTSVYKDNGIRLDKVMTNRYIPTRFNQAIEIRKENTLEPLHDLSRFSVPFEQLIYVPPTMSPVESGANQDYLEYPTDVFEYFKSKGVTEVVCETKHMGSRMVSLICKDEYVATKLFKMREGQLGVSWTRSGYRFFKDTKTELEVNEILHKAITDAGMWETLKTDWILLDSEMMPWNYKGEYSLIVKQYADIGCSGIQTLKSSIDSLKDYVPKEDDTTFKMLFSKYSDRLSSIEQYNTAYKNYIWKINSTSDLKIAPFHILATSKTVHSDKTHLWHIDNINKIVDADDSGVLKHTDYVVINTNDETQVQEACQKWLKQTNEEGAEGMVIKPMSFLQRDNTGLYVQPAIKCRGKEYLRIIYGAEYTLPQNMPKLRKRNVKKKRFLAMNEFLLGLEGLHRFCEQADLESIHECVFGTLSLNAEFVDSRL